MRYFYLIFILVIALFIPQGVAGQTAENQAVKEARARLSDSIRRQVILFTFQMNRETKPGKWKCEKPIYDAKSFTVINKFLKEKKTCNDTDLPLLKKLAKELAAWQMPAVGPSRAEDSVIASIQALSTFQDTKNRATALFVRLQLMAYIQRMIDQPDWQALRSEDKLVHRIQSGLKTPAVEGGIFAVLLLMGGGWLYLLLRKKKPAKTRQEPQKEERPLVETHDRASQPTEDGPTSPPAEDNLRIPPAPLSREAELPTLNSPISPDFIESSRLLIPDDALKTADSRLHTDVFPADTPKRSVLEPPSLTNPISPELRSKPETDANLVVPEHRVSPPPPTARPVAPEAQQPPVLPPPPAAEPAETFPDPVVVLYFGFPDDHGVYDPTAARQRYQPGRTYLEMNVLPGETTAWFRLCEEIDTAMARNLVLQWPSIAPVCYAESLSDAVLRFDTQRPGLAALVNGNWVCTRKAVIRCVEA